MRQLRNHAAGSAATHGRQSASHRPTGRLAAGTRLAALLRDGDLGRHARKSRRIYQARRDHLAGMLIDKLGDRLDFEVPAGGLALWTCLKPGLDAERWSHEARRLGLAVTPGLTSCLDVARAPQAFRLGYAGLNAGEIDRAVMLLVEAGRSLTL